MNIQRLFGSQRALETVEDFTEFAGRRRRPELRGQAVFFGKGTCATCHVPPYYTDNLMHNLQAERFFNPGP